MPPGHIPIMAAGTEIVEFSPKEPYQQSMEMAAGNFEAMQQG